MKRESAGLIAGVGRCRGTGFHSEVGQCAQRSRSVRYEQTTCPRSLPLEIEGGRRLFAFDPSLVPGVNRYETKCVL
ncbi:hypothetical protein NPIL_473661 [Nephila pilipes]|uniref:Uncharacterized protein n=1 Tax=Nephila pilipes TaxID=299642 RepID=A0A8X6TB22_NEPPI|nr:hypothetical protein NPIL_473661 [Nephila pilipes]